MNLVNWSNFLPDCASVTFSSLAIPDVERSGLNRDIAEIALPAGRFIDVEWCDDNGQYRITPFQDVFECELYAISCDTPSEVVEWVKYLAEDYSNPSVFASATSSETLVC
jgi:hypothetical protein